MNPVINYDELLKKIPYKFAIPIAVAKRAENLKEFAHSYVETWDNNYVSIALKELSEGYIRIKNEEILKVLIPNVK
ncbi:DNA-directed RNA polymerase subunit omega [Thermosipho melanesiensis]|uniref:DNA-directed RNA polymerase subunit omega n=2 Tax=Thermosipho melanesiensis TaxID=46541 RepID=RPOZ_THEM4|nr:DNA-directed RNA polymerase subunit omega [Thermosipho melanesiensis]A6LJ74.1 RecName: Full=DNA-directed RNA polymerase subunit omega; Short=RNAP omega subunit; AltName: Full=RNA polymerase omega subunit; AltName: Full=Transcriptase subunit omega [Thermosipho melanesiensis BI429]ABR29975.1 DNA-directed RNA polymerase, omega subunit [Thermosipho melanesiensis BI429]APT73179.1 DNA-directed RNA polymerase subunit omega [Thermosipho melanesiensis]OOC38575.1 DNA-directed RNA polymerase subunit om